MTPWDRFLHWLWRRVGEPGMQCHRPHVEPGKAVTVYFMETKDERAGVVNSVNGSDYESGECLVTRIVLRNLP